MDSAFIPQGSEHTRGRFSITVKKGPRPVEEKKEETPVQSSPVKVVPEVRVAIPNTGVGK